MGFFFFIILVGGIIVMLIVKRQGNVAGEWARAATQLGLNYSRGGLVNPHWIYGKKAGLRFDIKTFNRSSGGSGNQKWTGYRVRFLRSTDLRIRVTESVRKRLSSRFQECEIDDQGIFCARPGTEGDAPAIIDNVERLQGVTAQLLASAEAEQAADNPARPTVPPPLQSQPPSIPAESSPEEAQPPPETPAVKSISLQDIVKESHDHDASETEDAVDVIEEGEDDSPFELDAEAIPPLPETERSDAEPIENDAPEPEAAEPKNEDDEAKLDAPETTHSPEPLTTLTGISHDLFDSGRNHFQITQRFDAEYRGLSMMGEGKLVRANPYSNDRIFGRGPGTLAEVEIDHPEEPLSGHGTIRAVLQLPETASHRALRENIGDTVTISGTLLRCDAFDGRIFLGGGEIA